MTAHVHKTTGWRRIVENGLWTIEPTDTSGPRIVRPLSAGSWQNDPNDDPANQTRDRIVLLSGVPLPDWAAAWLETVNHRECERARQTFRAIVDRADWDESMRDAWRY
jgi:hypothetical protein